MKTTSTMTLGIGIASSGAGEAWFDFVNGGESFGLVRDGAWHEVAVATNYGWDMLKDKAEPYRLAESFEEGEAGTLK
mgnify:CR=1 FL=1